MAVPLDSNSGPLFCTLTYYYLLLSLLHYFFFCVRGKCKIFHFLIQLLYNFIFLTWDTKLYTLFNMLSWGEKKKVLIFNPPNGSKCPLFRKNQICLFSGWLRGSVGAHRAPTLWSRNCMPRAGEAPTSLLSFPYLTLEYLGQSSKLTTVFHKN